MCISVPSDPRRPVSDQRFREGEWGMDESRTSVYILGMGPLSAAHVIEVWALTGEPRRTSVVIGTATDTLAESAPAPCLFDAFGPHCPRHRQVHAPIVILGGQ